MILSELRSMIAAVLMDCYRDPRPTESVWAWADRSVFLDGAATPRPGYYRSIETPWVREFCDTLLDPAWREDLVLKSSRTGFTEAALNCVRYMPENFPGNVIIAEHTRDAAKDISRGRLARTFQRAAAGKMSDDPDDDGTFVKFLQRMTVWIAGSFSKGLFREKWARYIFVDEVEANPEIPDEGFILQQAASRFTGVENPTLHAISKPKRHGSLFHRRAAAGTCSVYLVECPHCGTWQELSFDGTSASEHMHIEGITAPLLARPAPLGRLRFEHTRDLLGQYDKAAVARTTYYQCVSGCRIEDIDRTGVPRSPFGPGRWLATNPAPHPGRRSRHISDLYSPYADVAWGALALKWIDCADQLSRDDFKNNHLGLPAAEQAATISERSVLDCRSAYKRGEAPFAPDLVLLNWDTQDDVVEWGITAARLVPGRDLPELALVDFGKAFHPDELLEIAREPISLPDGTRAAVHYGLGDAGGHRTADIYETCLKSLTTAAHLFPAYGRGGMQARHPLRETVFKHGQREVTGYLFSDDQYKRRLYFDLIGNIADHRRLAAERGWGLETPQVRLHLPADLLDTKAGEQFKNGLLKERTVERQTRRGLVTEWDENIRGNEAGDILKQALVAFDFMRPALQRESAARAAKKAAEQKPSNPNPA